MSVDVLPELPTKLWIVILEIMAKVIWKCLDEKMILEGKTLKTL